MTLSTKKMTANRSSNSSDSSFAQDAVVPAAMEHEQPSAVITKDVEAVLDDDQASTIASDASKDEITVVSPQKSRHKTTCYLLAGFGVCMLIGGLLVRATKYGSNGQDEAP